jgi:hypothetical protein
VQNTGDWLGGTVAILEFDTAKPLPPLQTNRTAEIVPEGTPAKIA